ncbi:MAG: response regulator [Bacteroidota bacterium]|nr:response regulator [Bacteroidota bacterium]MDP4248585.1 response regulator [Bacteroidota bacterium]
MSIKVLIIDDECDLCELICGIFAKEDFEFACARSLREAEEKLQLKQDIIILDHNLPDGLGLEFLKKHRESFDNSRIIMISADPNLNLLAQAAKEGVSGFLQKPFSMHRIREVIKSVTDSNQ